MCRCCAHRADARNGYARDRTGSAELREITAASCHGMFTAIQLAMDIVTWLIVGLVAGVLAGLVVGGYGILADMVVGMVGAYIGGWLFLHEGWHAPISGIGGSIFIAFIGALILLVILRIFRSATYSRPL
jgi:uncharacterized membrane protein YeaQ/YmgE (transglycosylase-associated protein family)